MCEHASEWAWDIFSTDISLRTPATGQTRALNRLTQKMDGTSVVGNDQPQRSSKNPTIFWSMSSQYKFENSSFPEKKLSERTVLRKPGYFQKINDSHRNLKRRSTNK